jgi:SMODS and SLOG-associating 2TM effector domain 1
VKLVPLCGQLSHWYNLFKPSRILPWEEAQYMAFFRRDISVQKDEYKTAIEYYSAIREGFREKANQNKIESQITLYGMIIFTLFSPLFVTLGTGWFWGKVVPAVLSVLAAAFTSWAQIRKPQQLWTIYRGA